MKYATLLLIVCCLGCSKSSSEKSSGNSIVGKWIQTGYLADPGDGSGTWQDDDSGDGYIIFRSDSTAESNGMPYFGDLESYSLTSDSTISLTYSDGSVFYRGYTIDENTLILGGGCIEACASKYKRVD